MKALLLACIVTAAVLASCTGQVPEPTSAHVARAQARWPDTTARDLRAGRELFVERCSGCHTLPRPSQHSAKEWPGIMAKMTPLVHMKPDQIEKVQRYLMVLSEP